MAQEPRSSAGAGARSFLPEIQALRAVAVLLVVVYHLWPARLTGGYVGVDVFFVISGFLITSHLHREVARRGTVSLAAFYARRAGRLLPAATVVLLASLAGAYCFLPSSRWAATAGDVLASAFYVANWNLAARAVDYSASQDAASVVQHYWSLSVEEQFYLVWPALILLLVAAAHRAGRSPRGLILPGILAVTVLSFGWSIYATATDPAAAYFQTPTRVWELGVGAILALTVEFGAAHRAPALWPVGLRWVGLAAIAGSAVTLTSASAFPGYAALLPVLGTAAVIAAGDTGRRDPLTPVVELRPVQFLGDVSYSLYLWHWPVIVLAPFVLARPMAATDKLVVLAGCIVLAWLTGKVVEAPPQRWRLMRRPRIVAGLTALTMGASAAAAAGVMHLVTLQEADARAELAEAAGDPCFGAGAMAPGATGCGEVFGPPESLILTADDEPWFADPACTVTEGELSFSTCRYGDGAPIRTVALVGDSHAEHWRGALHELARHENWELVEILRGACPVTEARVLTFQGKATDTEGCARWGQQVTDYLETRSFDTVFTSSFTTAFTFGGAGDTSADAGRAGFESTWSRWADAGRQVYVLRDVPTTAVRHVPECLQANPDDPLACSRPRSEAVLPDPAIAAVGKLNSDRVRLVDLTSFFCNQTTCYTAIGGAVVYWDANHLSGQFSRSLAPFLREAIA